MATRRPARPARLTENLVLRAAAYYALLFAVVMLVLYQWPQFVRASPELVASARAAAAELRGLPGAADAAVASATDTLALTVLLAMGSAVLLSLPVAWVYRLTRSKRGYQQSVVQTLVILPMVVAGVVVLVKDSLALAFGLAGIVAAVRFRTPLDDSKDAMYVFLATGVGLAAAVDVPVAAVLSIVFNAVILMLWYTDFGRQPAHLEGRRAERQLDQALEELGRTGTFVARVDDQVFRDMSAEQLQALMERASRRARQNAPERNGSASEPRPESTLHVHASDGEQARRAIEPLLVASVKRWRFVGMQAEPDGRCVVRYAVVLRKSVDPAVLVASVRAAGIAGVVDVELD